MNLNLKDKKVFITGASKGLGLQMVKSFAEEDAIVTMCARNRDTLEAARESLPFSDKQLFIHPMDITNYREVFRGIEVVVEKMRGLDILVNNVGNAAKFAGFFELEEQDWIDTYKQNLMSIVNTVKVAHPYLKKSNSPRIINISSLTGFQPGGFSPHYSTSKAAVINLSKHLANILVKDKILVNCIVPGTFESDSWKRNIQRVSNEKGVSFEDAEKLEVDFANNTIPINRIGKTDDIVPLILLMASELSSWTTGSCYIIDGGKMRSIH